MIFGNLYKNNILFLQGPMGSFFYRLSKYFETLGSNSYFIALNGGDLFFSNWFKVSLFSKDIIFWEKFITNYLIEKNINKICLIGDCREYHKIAINVAKTLNIDVLVFEEGYIRPNYITVEKFGVNANSNLKYDDNIDYNINKRKKIENSYMYMAFSAALYYFMMFIFNFLFPYYNHHKDSSILNEIKASYKSFVKKIYNQYFEYIDDNLFKKDYIFVPLQVHTDFQVKSHSKYSNIEEFIDEVLFNFSSKKMLYNIVFKHHPMDRGKKDYKTYILNKCEELSIDKNIVFIYYDVDLKKLIKEAKGIVTINSTVGVSSLYYNKPLLTLGNAFYDKSNLVTKKWKEFWKFKNINEEKSLKFRNFLIAKTQLNSSFYGQINFDAFKEKMYSHTSHTNIYNSEIINNKFKYLNKLKILTKI